MLVERVTDGGGGFCSRFREATACDAFMLNKLYALETIASSRPQVKRKSDYKEGVDERVGRACIEHAPIDAGLKTAHRLGTNAGMGLTESFDCLSCRDHWSRCSLYKRHLLLLETFLSEMKRERRGEIVGRHQDILLALAWASS